MNAPIAWLRKDGADVVLRLHVQPGAKRSEVVGLHGGALKIRLAAPPVDGKANECLIAFLADRLALSRSNILLEAGTTSRAKRVRLLGATEVAVKALI